jgi:exodeoxyribonuclease I
VRIVQSIMAQCALYLLSPNAMATAPNPAAQHSASHTFLWHDYETFGANTRRDRPAQFAAIRTDAQLNEIGQPIMQYCQPAPDFLPEPEACLITGITPQICLEQGVPEYQFAKEIEQAFSASGTIGVGYNTIRFDDEITRHMFWRNLIDPYAREWQNQCGRWDILDLVRTAHALRPEGITWPTREDGQPSFKLEHLCAANGIGHESAHDALSDVRATIALARLIRELQPRLFDFCFDLHKKDKVAQELGLHLPVNERKPVLHVSGMFPTQHGCLALVWPLAQHPRNKNEVIVWDCRYDPSELFTLDAATIRQRMFTAAADLPEGITRLPIKTIHLNRSPIVIGNLKTLSTQQAERWQIDVSQAHQHAQLAAQLSQQRILTQEAIWAQVFQAPETDSTPIVEEDLYGGFLKNTDRKLLNDLRALPPAALAKKVCHFEDPRLFDLVLRYRARNFPETLNEAELEQWEQWRAGRLLEGAGGVKSIDDWLAEIEQLTHAADERGQTILEALHEYAEAIVPMN